MFLADDVAQFKTYLEELVPLGFAPRQHETPEGREHLVNHNGLLALFLLDGR